MQIGKSFEWSIFIISTLLQPKYAYTVFECNFDNGLCPNGPFTFNQNRTYGGIVDNQVLQGMALYRITDVTSITTPTSDGKICKIPFIEGNYKCYHCFNKPPYICHTESGIANCVLGKFLLGKTAITGTSLSARGSSSEIVLPEIGSYELSFYILMFTNITDMTLGGDYIEVSLYNSSDSELSFMTEKYDYTNIGKPNVWNQKFIPFSATETNILLTVDFVRLNNLRDQGFFGFDQIQIKKTGGNTDISVHSTIDTTRTTPTTTTSAITTKSASTASSVTIITSSSTSTTSATITTSITPAITSRPAITTNAETTYTTFITSASTQASQTITSTSATNKTSSNNTLIIVLSITIPLIAIGSLVGIILIKKYQKQKSKDIPKDIPKDNSVPLEIYI